MKRIWSHPMAGVCHSLCLAVREGGGIEILVHREKKIDREKGECSRGKTTQTHRYIDMAI